LFDSDFNLAGRHPGVLHALGSPANPPAGGNDPLAADVTCDLVNLRLCLRVKNKLHEALAVAQVNKYKISMVAIGLHPAANNDRLIHMIGANNSTIMSSFEHVEFFQITDYR